MDSPLDMKIKFDQIQDTFSLLNLSKKRKKKVKTERAEQFRKRMNKNFINQGFQLYRHQSLIDAQRSWLKQQVE
jgi:methionine-rich copper-binding protein CopC